MAFFDKLLIYIFVPCDLYHSVTEWTSLKPIQFCRRKAHPFDGESIKLVASIEDSYREREWNARKVAGNSRVLTSARQVVL